MSPCVGKAKKHDPIHADLQGGGSLWVCVRCKKILSAHKAPKLTEEEVEALCEYFAYLRDETQKKGKTK